MINCPRITCPRVYTAVLFVSCLTCPPSWGQDRATIEGTWKGMVVYEPAVFEVEQTIDLFQDARGVLAGLIDVPVKPIEDEPLSAIRVDGRQISWELLRDSGTFRYEGTLSEDGNEISGQFLDRGKLHPFWLRRADPSTGEPPRVQPPLHTLSATGAELKERFNRDAGQVRLILLLSPGCMFCTASARVVQLHVLDKIPDERLRVYVVWGPYKERERESDARSATAFVPDPRATHFWTETPAPGNLFNDPLKRFGLGPLSAWDSFLLFAPETRWEEAVPAPAHFMHRDVEGRPLHGTRLFEQVRDLLAAAEKTTRAP